MTPYKQAYIVTTENGAVSLVVVMARHSTEGKQMAKDAAAEAEQCDAWDVCAYPTTSDLREGVRWIFAKFPNE